MSQLYEIPGNEAKWLHFAYHKAYPRLEHGYWKHVQDSLKSNRTTRNLLGRQIMFLMPWGDKMLHNAYSSIPQSTCADVIDSRGIAFTYYNEAPHFRTVELLTQVHDSIAFQMPLSTPIIDHAKVILDIKASLETPLVWHSQTINTPVDLVVGKNLNKRSNYSKKVSLINTNIDALAYALKETHMKLT
jgi:DNA polymerase I-like protein with 3'-5' exonuclease and polymerase domains